MSRALSDEVTTLIKQLIHQISGFEEGTDVFKHVERYMKSELRKADNMYFLNKRDVDENIQSMSEKYRFHGFSPQAEALKMAYNKCTPKDLSKSDLMTRLNVIKFLLCMSQSPTDNFLKHPEEYVVTQLPEEKEEINWTEYLNEGIEKWDPDFDQSSGCSDSSSLYGDCVDTKAELSEISCIQPIGIDHLYTDEIVDLRANRDELFGTIQHTWYNESHVHLSPESQWADANVGILWEDFLKEEVKGLIPYASASILSEYKVIREILWQLWEPHASSVFELDGNQLKPKSNVTISSVRSVAFERFLEEFIPYVEHLDFFREFSQSLKAPDNDTIVPQTYISYGSSLDNIIKPVYNQLSDLEEKVRMQDETITLLKLAEKLRTIFEPVIALKKIHQEVVIDFKSNSSLECSANLLARLHNSLQYSGNKLEQDLRLTLFLESLCHYFQLMDSWLMKDDLSDYTKEFLIINNNTKNYNMNCSNENNSSSRLSELESWQLNFELQPNISDFCKSNNIIRIIRDQVLQIGSNIHLLRLLGKFNLINDSAETIHEEFVKKSLRGLSKFYNVNLKEASNIDNDDCKSSSSESSYKNPVVCLDESTSTEMDKLENLVDATDMYFMKAFGDYFVEKPIMGQAKTISLYETISKTTVNLFPVQNFFENILNDILKERFTVSGLMVKNLLIEQFKLDRQFAFLRHIFLFFDDLIFPFYRRFFEKMDSYSKNWGNEVWLTSHLQDVIVDIYPDFYESCSVQMSELWRTCSDSLEACGIINLQHVIQWPLNIIITTTHMAMYREIFQFILRIKWALYTVNHLNFTDIEPKKKSSSKNPNKNLQAIIMKLKYLKFSLNNIANNIQHYIFGFVFSKCLMKFELDFEKSNDLKSIMAAHEEFIFSVYRMVTNVRDYEQERCGFKMILNCVKMLKVMWSDIADASPDKLTECFKLYKCSYDVVNPLINPVYIFDY